MQCLKSQLLISWFSNMAALGLNDYNEKKVEQKGHRPIWRVGLFSAMVELNYRQWNSSWHWVVLAPPFCNYDKWNWFLLIVNKAYMEPTGASSYMQKELFLTSKSLKIFVLCKRIHSSDLVIRYSEYWKNHITSTKRQNKFMFCFICYLIFHHNAQSKALFSTSDINFFMFWYHENH